MQRKLASLQRVLQVMPIANADAIELVRINGWQCVTKKGEFVPGDLGVYFEIDAIPPDEPIFRFLWTPRSAARDEVFVRPDKFRIRTLKLRGALSQGLFVPVAQFALGDLPEGTDVTELLQVGKYEPPASNDLGERRGAFPPVVPKTDEIRVQSAPSVLEELRGHPYAITMKYDGTSSTFLIDPRDNEFHACGRNQSLRDGDNVYWQIARRYGLEAILRRHPHFAIQGEIAGPGIQKNPLGLKEKQLFVFDIFDMSNARHLLHGEARRFLADVGLPVVETIETGDAFGCTQDELLGKAEGYYPGTKNDREGLVIRSTTEMFSPTLGSRMSFKAISNRYLLGES